MGDLVSANLQSLLQKQLALVTKGEGLVHQQLIAPAMKGEGLVGAGISSLMQYMESLLENFSPGEVGLRLQLPLGMHQN